jgi:hypothetical protein
VKKFFPFGNVNTDTSSFKERPYSRASDTVRQILKHLTCQAVMAASVKAAVFWVVPPRSLVEVSEVLAASILRVMEEMSENYQTAQCSIPENGHLG